MHTKEKSEGLVMEYIGKVGVDSGTMMLGDPCYISDDKRLHSDEGWQKFCKEVLFTKQYDSMRHAQIGRGTAVVTDTGYGDGEYSVYITRNNEGRVMSLTVVFIDEEE